MISLESAVQNIVENNLRETNYNDSIIISGELSFSEWFAKPISQETVLKLQKQYPGLDIDTDGVKANLNLNFLFINRQGYYSCFYNNDYSRPLWKDETNWKFTSNHDTCWRDSAFSFAKDDIFSIRESISKISKEFPLENVSIPKHVIPNYSSISNTNLFQFKNIETDENYKKINHVLTSILDEYSLIVQEPKRIGFYTDGEEYELMFIEVEHEKLISLKIKELMDANIIYCYASINNVELDTEKVSLLEKKGINTYITIDNDIDCASEQELEMYNEINKK